MKRLSIALFATLLAACGGGGETTVPCPTSTLRVSEATCYEGLQNPDAPLVQAPAPPPQEEPTTPDPGPPPD